MLYESRAFTKVTISRWATIREGRGVELLQGLEDCLWALKAIESNSSTVIDKGTPELQFNSYVMYSHVLYSEKFVEYFEAAVDCINNERYVVLAGCLRSVLEHLALLHFFIHESKAAALLSKWELRTANSDDYDCAISDLDRFLRGNGFAWDALIDGRVDELTKKRASSGTQLQVRIAKSPLNRLSRDFEKTQVLYNMLCDMVHPNLGSHMLLLRTSNSKPCVGGKSSKDPALSLIVKPMALMMGVYEIVVTDLNHLLSFYLAAKSNKIGGKKSH